MTTEQILTEFAIEIAKDIKTINSKLETFVFDQMISSSEWNVNHNLNRNPSVVVIDSAGTEVVCHVQYIDKNNITIITSFPFSGKAFLN